MSSWVVVYTRSGCVQCRATERALTAAGIEFEVRNIEDQTEDKLQTLRRVGTTAPIVITETAGEWSGFQPARIAELAAAGEPATDPTGRWVVLNVAVTRLLGRYTTAADAERAAKWFGGCSFPHELTPAELASLEAEAAAR